MRRKHCCLHMQVYSPQYTYVYNLRCVVFHEHVEVNAEGEEKSKYDSFMVSKFM